MTQPLIEKISVQTVLVPITPPHQTASGLVDKSPLVLIELHCVGGLIGNAILFTYTPAALKSTAELVAGFSELLVGHALAPRSLNEFLIAKTRLIGSQGLVGTVLAGIDMAAWLETARQAEDWVKKGFKAVKAKIGYPTASEDLAVIRAMRKAVGPDIELMVDYNQSLQPVDAIRRLKVLDEEGLVWIEEPILGHDYSNTARIKDALNTPIQSGENWWGAQDMQLAIDADASDYVMPDAMKIGGVTGWLKAVDIAAGAGKQVSSHLWPELSAQLLAVGSTSHRLEYVDWWAEILTEPLVVENGMTVLPDDLRGSGVEFDKNKVDRYRV